MKFACSLFVLGIGFILAGGCSRRNITTLDRKKAAALASEADFAVTVREDPRAESLLSQAANLCPDNGSYWVALASTRMRIGRRGDARTAYKHALSAFRDAAAASKNDGGLALQQVYVLALLGRTSEARRLTAALLARYPNDYQVRAFVDNKGLDRLLANPEFKKLMP